MEAAQWPAEGSRVSATARALGRKGRATASGPAANRWPRTAAAWKMKPRDLWIGWCDEQRQRHLQWIVNNGRFLILPWVHVSGLASKILALAARQLPADWESHYGHRPLLLETLVDASRFRGTCYRAANWIYVGQTTGRGRMDREHKAHGQAIKAIYVYPLVRNAKQRLCS